MELQEFSSPDNDREFKNADLEKVVKEFATIQMHGRQYHPQSQGRVERFNRTMTEYFRRIMVEDSNWVGSLTEFYYRYNNRVHKATRLATPRQPFSRRPNFAVPMDDQLAKNSKKQMTTKEVQNRLYPLEEFSNNLQEDVIFFPNIGGKNIL